MMTRLRQRPRRYGTSSGLRHPRGPSRLAAGELARSFLALALIAVAIRGEAASTAVDEGQTGHWAMAFWSLQPDERRFGLQGDLQYRDWSFFDDLEQTLVRAGVTYRHPGTPALLTLGVANIRSGAYGSSGAIVNEHRLYQEALLYQRVAARLQLRHRFRYEQRWIDDQDLRTRFRYALFADIPLTESVLRPGVPYIALYNELFVNGERSIGDGRQVEYFDRNRLYAGIGLVLTDAVRAQLGYMEQRTDAISKGQMQFSVHYAW